LCWQSRDDFKPLSDLVSAITLQPYYYAVVLTSNNNTGSQSTYYVQINDKQIGERKINDKRIIGNDEVFLSGHSRLSHIFKAIIINIFERESKAISKGKIPYL